MSQAKAVNMIKGAIRKAFTWYSEEYKAAMTNAIVRIPIKDKDGNNTGRFRDFVKCTACEELFYKKDIQVDHINPIGKAFNWPPDASLLEWIGKVWCKAENLQPLCLACHKRKCSEEKKAGRYK